MWLFQLASVGEPPQKKLLNFNFYVLPSTSQVEKGDALSYKNSASFRGKMNLNIMQFDDGSKVFLDFRATAGQVYSKSSPDNKLDLYASAKGYKQAGDYALETGAVAINTVRLGKEAKLGYQPYIKAYGPDTELGRPALEVDLNLNKNLGQPNINVSLEDYFTQNSKVYLSYNPNKFTNTITVSFGAEINFKDIGKIAGL